MGGRGGGSVGGGVRECEQWDGGSVGGGVRECEQWDGGSVSSGVGGV